MLDGLRFKQLLVSFLRRATGRTQAGFPAGWISHSSPSSNVRSRSASLRTNQPRHSSWRSALRSSRRSGPTLYLPHGVVGSDYTAPESTATERTGKVPLDGMSATSSGSSSTTRAREAWAPRAGRPPSRRGTSRPLVLPLKARWSRRASSPPQAKRRAAITTADGTRWRGAIQSGYLVRGKGSSMTVGGPARTKAELQWQPYL